MDRVGEEAATGSGATGRRGWRASLLLALAFGLLYALFRQQTFYKHDAINLLGSLDFGHWGNQRHLLWSPLVYFVHRALEPLGASLFGVGTWLSVLGGAVGVGCVHAGFRRCLAPRAALLAAGIVGLCPAVFFFSTVVEYHGPFLIALGVSFWVFRLWCERPHSVGRTIGLGASLTFAWGMHSTGPLMFGVWAAWYFFEGSDEGPQGPAQYAKRAGRLALVLAAHLGTIAAVYLAARVLGTHLRLGATEEELAVDAHWDPGITELAQMCWDEWLLPFLPLSFALPLLLLLPQARRSAVFSLVALVPYLVLCALKVIFTPEFGAYLLPMAVPLAYCAARALPAGLCLLAMGGGAAYSVHWITEHDDPAVATGYGQAVRNAFGQRTATLLVGAVDEYMMAFIAAPEFRLYPIVYGSRDAESALVEFIPSLPDFVEGELAAGREVYVTALAMHFLANLSTLAAGDPAGQARIRGMQRYLTESFELVPGEGPAAAFLRLLPKAR